MEIICTELGVPKIYLKATTRSERFVAVVHSSWLMSILNNHKVIKFEENENFDEWPANLENLGSSWRKVYICVYKKRNDKVIPLPRIHSTSDQNGSALTFLQLLHYIMQTNHKNLWKEAYKKYVYAGYGRTEGSNHPDGHITLTDHDSILREVLLRAYGCSSINIIGDTIQRSRPDGAALGLLPAVCIIESSLALFTIHTPYLSYTLQDCITFSPAILEDSLVKPMFIVFQLLQALRALHDRGLTIGDITLSDIYMSENLWLQIMPRIDSNLLIRNDSNDFSSIEKKNKKSRIHSTPQCGKNVHIFDNLRCIHCGTRSYDKIIINENIGLERMCELWTQGRISNLTYLTALNNLAGRKFGDPSCHHIMPWVTDFSSRCGNNWRDLTKSKFRLNKGDRQLDLTYESSGSTQMAHHVTDVLSSITYYVYMARRTLRSVLCHHVRTTWVPAEYPVSIQRLQEWTPDECIPEFFTSPIVFKSIHEDLPDLEIPPWSSSPEDFVEKHREALESSYVSDRLHHWIDLTFGYKLSGTAAIKSKNVCLQLVDNHQALCSAGVVQLFHVPHPPRFSSQPHPWIGRLPPKINFIVPRRKKHRDKSTSLSADHAHQSDDEDISSGFEDDTMSTVNSTSNRSPLGLTRFLSRSRNSLNEDLAKVDVPITSLKMSPKSQKTNIFPIFSSEQTDLVFNTKIAYFSGIQPNVTNLSLGQPLTVQKSFLNSGNIYLPKEYNPVSVLQAIESFHNFLSKTFNCSLKKNQITSEKMDDEINQLNFIIEKNINIDDDDIDCKNSFTNRIFVENYEIKLKNNGKTEQGTKLDKQPVQITDNQNYKQAMALRRLRELQVLGCLVVEIFLAKQLRALGPANRDFDTRSNACSVAARLNHSILPPSIRSLVDLLLQLDLPESQIFRYPTVTDKGLPPPSAHQLLQPILSSSSFSFPCNFWEMYTFFSTLHQFSCLTDELEICTYFNCSGNDCLKFKNIEYTKLSILSNMAECKVKTCSIWLDRLLYNAIGFETIELILPYVVALFEDKDCSILAAWYLFDPIARALGSIRSSLELLEPILKLYEGDSDCNPIENNKMIKLFHHSFLLQLIVRFGLRKFLDNFITPLVEAVGGYRDLENEDIQFHRHNSDKPCLSRKTSNLKTIESNENYSEVLSPFEDESVIDLEKNFQPLKTKYIVSETEIKSNYQQLEPEMFSFDNDDKVIQGDTGLTYNINHFDQYVRESLIYGDNLDTAFPVSEENFSEQLQKLDSNDDEQHINSPISPSILIPKGIHHKNELSTIGCKIGSIKNVEENEYHENLFQVDHLNSEVLNFNVNTQDSSNENDKRQSAEQEQADNIHSQNNKSCKLENEGNISDVSAASILWLSHRLGPVLTARYLSRNLLRMLTLCYLGKDNLTQLLKTVYIETNIDPVCIVHDRIVGDASAGKVLECLLSIAALYGEQLIVLQYIPHMAELIALCKRKLTSNLEGGLISCITLLRHIIPYMSDMTLVDQIQDILLKSIIGPCIRLISTTRHSFPSGITARTALTHRLINVIYLIVLRVGTEAVNSLNILPIIQKFFVIFDKAAGYETDICIPDISQNEVVGSPVRSLEESSYIELRRDGSTAEWAVRGGIALRVDPNSSSSSWSPLSPNENELTQLDEGGLKELQEVFTGEFAYTVYTSFARYLGDSCLELCLKNYSYIKELCDQYEQEIKLTYPQTKKGIFHCSDGISIERNELIGRSTGSFGSNVSLVGNRIDVFDDQCGRESEISTLISNKMENTTRHLRGNWLAYWEHEIGRADKDTRFNFKQIKLQSFNGHTNAVRALCVLDNENSFMSGGRDKTVKLWSLRSQGDGTTVGSAQWTYTGHKKSVLSVTLVESLRLAVSCDSGVHVWDPFMGTVLCQLEGQRSVTALLAAPSPSTMLFAATADGAVRIIDIRLCSYVHELRLALNPVGPIRCLAVSPCGRWLAAGLSTGGVTLLDVRFGGKILASWRSHDGELLQMVAYDPNTLVTSSLDQTISIWNTAADGKLKYHLRGTTEPVHCLSCYNQELITGTTANRIGVYTAVSPDSSFSSTKLRSETFRGVLTCMAVLPLNKLLLLGSDSGNINLLC